VLVGEHAVLAGLGGAGLGAQREQVVDDLGGAVAGHALDEREVGRDDVVTYQEGGLVRGYPDVGTHVVTVVAMAEAESAESRERPSAASPVMLWLRHTRDQLWRVIVTTVASCLKYRVTGLAAEAAFFAVLSVPPLIFAMAGAIGFVSDQFTAAQVDDVRNAVIDLSQRALTDGAVNRIIVPTIDDVLKGGRFDVISLGFVLALWSGSRALNVFVDTITIMHGLGGHRGIVKTRALSFLLYVLAMVTGVVSIPLVVAGPALVEDWLPDRLDFLMHFYWPAVIVICICFLATLYHVSVPVRTNWSFNLPGATFSLVCWILGSYVLRWFLTVTATDSRSIYGPLAAPIAVLLWLYLVSIAVLIGAAVNAAFDTVFPQKSTVLARIELMQRLRRIGSREPTD
jgi:membrane protein